MNLADYDKKYNTSLERRVQDLQKRAKELGARQAEQRLHIVADNFTALSTAEAYSLLDPAAFRHEVEEGHFYRRGVKGWQYARTMLALAPLILTWASLSIAIASYAEYASRHSGQAIPPFLQLWQQGSLEWLTFSITGTFDVFLLISFLIANTVILWIEYRARRTAEQDMGKWREVTDDLIKATIRHGVGGITSDAQIQLIMKYIKEAIHESYQDLEGIITGTQQTIKDIGEEMKNLLSSQVQPLITTFTRSTNDFRSDLGTLNVKVKEFADAGTQMASASSDMAAQSKDLAVNVSRHASAAQDIGAHLASLKASEGQLAQDFKGAANSIDAAAQHMGDAAKDVSDVGKQLTLIDSQNMKAIMTEIRQVMQEANAFARTMGQANKDLQQALAALGKSVGAGQAKSKSWWWPF